MFSIFEFVLTGLIDIDAIDNFPFKQMVSLSCLQRVRCVKEKDMFAAQTRVTNVKCLSVLFDSFSTLQRAFF